MINKYLISILLSFTALTSFGQLEYLGSSNIKHIYPPEYQGGFVESFYWQNKLVSLYVSDFESYLSVSDKNSESFEKITLNTGNITYKVINNELYFCRENDSELFRYTANFNLEFLYNFSGDINDFYTVNTDFYVQIHTHPYPVYQLDLQSQTIVDTLSFNNQRFKHLLTLNDKILVAERFNPACKIKLYSTVNSNQTELATRPFDYSTVQVALSNHSSEKYYIDADSTFVFNIQTETFSSRKDIDKYDEFYFENDSTVVTLSGLNDTYTNHYVQRLNFRADTLFSVDTIVKTAYQSDTIFDLLFDTKTPYFLQFTNNTGAELVNYANGTLTTLPEVNTGMFSSFDVKECFNDGSNSTDVEINGQHYFVASNGKTQNYYIYRLDGNQWVSLAKIPYASDYFMKAVGDQLILQCSTGDAYRFYSFNTTNNTPEQQPTVNTDEEWFRHTGTSTNEHRYCYNSGNTYQVDTKLDEDGNIYTFSKIAGSSYSANSKFVDPFSSVQQPQYGKMVLTKHNSNGDLVWAQTFGGTNYITTYLRASHIHFNEDGSMSVTHLYYKDFNSELDTLGHDYSTYPFEMILDQQTGDILEIIDHFGLTQPYSANIRAITKDKTGNSYYLIKYPYFEQNIGDTTLYSDYDNQIALIKLSPQGEFIYARNLNGSFNAISPYKYDLTFDENNNSLYLTMHTVIDIEDYKRKYQIHNYDLEGNLNTVFEIYGKSGMSITNLLFYQDDIILLGKTRGNLTTNNYILQPPNDEEFNFTLSLRKNNLTPIEFKGIETDYRYIKATIQGDNIYALTRNNYDYSIVRINENLEIDGIKPLGRQGTIESINLKDDFIYLTGTEWWGTEVFKFNNYYASLNNNSLAKIKNTGYTALSPTVFYSFTVFNPESDYVTVYPNPFYQTFYVTLDLNHPYTNYTVYDLNGRQIGATTSIQHAELKISLADVAKGMYLIKFSGNGEEEVLRILKQ